MTSLACGIEGARDDIAEEQAALGTTYEVGPGKPFTSLSAVASRLAPGDVVRVYGNATYGSVVFTRPGTATDKITIRGVTVDGKRPLVSGGTNTIEFRANHYVMENMEVTGGSSRCVYHHAHDITIRTTAVHDCPAHGILGADTDSGSLTLDQVEVYRSGGGDRLHQIYMATDETAYPGAVFRMQNSWVHDAVGGNNVKSRAERNEIYGNWIEGAYYHELELIGPDGQDPALAREHSDVAGNVLRKTRSFYVVRFGGDGTGETDGRYRFVNNTVIVAPGSTSAVFRLFHGIESIEMHNNVFVRQGGGAPTILRTVEAEWTSGAAVIAGRNNWVPTGTTVPAQWTATRTGADPGLTDIAGRKLWPTATSPLVDAGADVTASAPGYPFPNPLPRPTTMPPRGVIEPILPRPVVGVIDIGAYEVGSAPPSCTTTAAVGATASTQEAANPAANAIDGSLATRWSGYGDGATLTVDLGSARELCSLAIAWYRGNLRTARFDVAVSATGTSYTTVHSGTSSGTTTALENVPVGAAGVRYVRIVGHGNSENLWNSITEVRAGTR